jgi:hypothetical protein
LRLGPHQREPFQPDMSLGFAVRICYSRSHFASSRAQ